MQNKKISVITVNLNNCEGLKKTLNSVICQSYINLEFVVIDGGSTDGSKALIQEYSSKITFWQSEKDAGVYDAMNKGINLSTGDYLLFLNSGDYFLDQNSISNLIDNSFGEDIVYGNLEVHNESSNWVKTYPSKLNFRYFYFDTLPHPAALISKKLFSKIGKYDTSLKIVSDWKFFLLAVVKYKCSYTHVSIAISAFEMDGVSSSPSNRDKILQERFKTLNSNFRFYFYLYSLYLKLLGKQIYPSYK
jgi:glycosyltransferase involved in cell wall biosynthesis